MGDQDRCDRMAELVRMYVADPGVSPEPVKGVAKVVGVDWRTDWGGEHETFLDPASSPSFTRPESLTGLLRPP